MAEISRRTLFGCALAVAGLAVGSGIGLTRPVTRRTATPPAPPPLELIDALVRQQALLAGYAALGSDPSRPYLAGLRADVVEHRQALHALLELYPGWRLSPTATGSAPVPVPAATVAALRTASSQLATELSTAAVGWPVAEEHALPVVPTLGSIAAALTTHAQVLR